MIRLFVVLLFAGSLVAQVVPMPKRVELGDQRGPSCRDVLASHDAFFPTALAFSQALQRLGVDGVRAAEVGAKNSVEFAYDAELIGEHYRIEVRNERVVATAGSTIGIAWAASTLLQNATVENGLARWSFASIDDAPDMPYRSFMVDMGRNPHSPKTLRAVVDAMWLCKVNFLHLHLTDDQLFSWPSTAFPKLCSERAGWARDDFVALERYSQARGVTIIPEIDVPGHSGILRRQYPDVFGKSPTDLATKASATEGLQTLIEEMLEVFAASPYMHVGGDEAYGVPHEAQRAFLNRLNKFVKSMGRRMVVWEGPPCGKGDDKVDQDVLHCCWRSLEFPAQRMLDEGYEVIAAPWDPMYIVDHYPRTMFTAVDVERCYRWDARRFPHINHGIHTFANPHVTKTAKGIVGFCMPWWEGREQNLLPLCVPRLSAVAAAAWNRKGERDFAAFLPRQQHLIGVFEKISGTELQKLPFADPATQRDNLAYRGKVTPSRGASQPHFGPQRLTNGIPDRFDHFLGFPTQPDALEIVIELPNKAKVSRVVVYERAVGNSHEIYELFASVDGVNYEPIGKAKKGSRGETDHVVHTFEARDVAFLKIATHGCHGLTFPSFSRICEVMAFAR